MSIQTRTTAIQNELVRLYCRFIRNGQLVNLPVQPSVDIVDTDGCTTIDSAIAQQESSGVYFVDWFVPKNLPLGNYYDRWTFQWDALSNVEELNMIFEVRSLDLYINFISNGTTIKLSDRTAQLLTDLSNDFIYEAQHIPIHWEQARRIQQEGQKKRIKSYYYFTISSKYPYAEQGATYTINGIPFTVFTTLELQDSSSSLSSDNSSGTISDSSESSSTSESSMSSISEESSLSNNSFSSQTSSQTYQEEYTPTQILTCVGSAQPPNNGTLTLVSGNGSNTLEYTSVEKKQSSFSTVYELAYKNWNMEPRPIVRLNNRIVDDGWHVDYEGKIYFDGLLAPEDSVNVSYNFSYFSKEELLSFLKLGLQMMNSVPPASQAYMAFEAAPRIWDAGILLYAAITAYKRLIFGLNWQEKMIIFGRPEDAQNAQSKFQELYTSYMETWTEYGKNIKTKKLPGIEMISIPAYTLPGGRSRWFRYLFKSS